MDTLKGFTPHRSHANWVLNIGNMTITGCQVNYAIECDTCETSIGFSLVCDKDTNEDFPMRSRIYHSKAKEVALQYDCVDKSLIEPRTGKKYNLSNGVEIENSNFSRFVYGTTFEDIFYPTTQIDLKDF